MENVVCVIPVTDIKGEKSRNQLEQLLNSPCFLDHEVLCVFDACSIDFIKYFQEKFPFIRSLQNTGNRLNFARNSNLGLRAIHGEGKSVILVNQDCKLPGDLSPLTTVEGVVSAQATNDLELSPGTGKLTEQHNKFPFYCVYIDKKVMDRVGYLDGVFIAGFDDDNYIARAMLAGFKCYVADLPIYHEGSFNDANKEGSASGAYTVGDLGVRLSMYLTQWQIPQEVGHAGAIPWILENHKWSENMRIK